MNRIKAEKEDEVDQAYAASTMADVNAKQARNTANQTDLRRQIRDDSGYGDGDKAWMGVANGIIAGLGTALAPVTGGLSLLATGAAFANQAAIENKSEEYDEAINKAIELGKTNGNLFDTKEAMAEALELDDQDLIDALWANKDSLEQLSADMNAADAAEKAAAQNAANEIMDDTGITNTKAGAMAMEAGGEIYQQLYDDAYNKVATGKKTSEEDFMKYAQEAGLTDLKGFEMGKRRSDGKVEYSYIDENGDEQTKVATQEEIAATLAAASAAKDLEGALSALRDKISELNNSEDLGDHAMANFLSEGNLEGATKEEYDDLKNDVSTNGKIDDKKVDAKLGLTGDAEADLETAKKYGYESAEAYREAFIKSLEIEWEVPAGIGEDLAGKLTVGAANKIQKTFEDMGEEGGQAYLDTINGIASGADWDALTPDEQTAMMDEIANIDWSSWDAGEQAVEIAKKYGIEIDTTTEAWRNNIAAMRDAADAVPDFEALRAQLQKVKEISESVELGSILSKEDYDNLVAYNDELSKYFTILSDGSAQFTGDLLDFQQAVKETNRQKLSEAIQAYEDQAGETRDKYNAGVKALGGNADNIDQYRDAETEAGAGTDTQLSFLESQDYDAEKIAQWKQELADGGDVTATLKAIGDAVNETANTFTNLSTEAESTNALIQGAMNEMALSAEDADERMKLFEDGLINEDAYNYAAQAAHNMEKWEGMDPKEVQQYSKSLQNAAKSSKILSEELIENEEAAEDVALYTKKMNQGVEKLSEGFEDWSDILKNSDESSEEYSEAMGDMKNAMSDVLGVSEDFLSDDFILDNMEDIKKAAEGDAEAIDRLAIAAGRDILVNLELQDEGVREEILALHEELAAEIPDIKVGATVDDGDFLAKAAQIVEQAGMTAEQANAYFRSMGFEANFETKQVPVESKQPIVETLTEDAGTENVTYEQVNPDGTTSTVSVPMVKTRQTSRTVGYTTSQEMMEVPALTTDDGSPNFTLTRTNAGAMNNSSSSNKGGGKKGGGGGGGSGGKVSKSNKSAQRYKTVDEKIDDNDRKTESAKNKIERSYGKDEDKAIEELLKANKEKKKLIKDKLAEAEGYLDDDKADLKEAAKALDIQFTFDKEGNITNYKKEMEDLYKELDDMEEAANKDGKATDAEKDAIDALKEKIETLEDAIDTYDETRETVQDLMQELEELAGMPPLPVITSDLIDIYKEVNDELDDIEDKLDKINGESERLTGANKVKKLKEAAAVEKEKLKTLEKQAELNAKDQKEKKDALNEMAKRHELKFQYDENGNITNYEEEMGKLSDEYKKLQQEFAADGGIDETEQYILD